MRYIADLHIHSRYSRACSPNLTPSNIAAWCRAKGIDIVATADFTHPLWLAELEEKLEEAEPGLYRIGDKYAAEDGGKGYRPAPQAKNGRNVRFICSTEISCIYKKGDRTRRLHLVVLAPDLKAARRLSERLEADGYNVRSDGRPILGLPADGLLKVCLEIDPGFMVIPAHAWTPWYSVFGSKSGFDSLEECFGDLSKEIYAIETGLSSDPPMNWRLSALDSVMLVSNSDVHGLANLGREANVFDIDQSELGFKAIADILKKHDLKRFLYTIEFFPEEGKYHADGCAACGFSCLPRETDRLGGRCPKCRKLITRGVMGRVHSLADREENPAMPKLAVPYRSIVPLEGIIAETLGRGKAAKAVDAMYRRTLGKIGPEFDVLLDADEPSVSAVHAPLAEAIRRVRAGQVSLCPGYDGVFGQVAIFDQKERERMKQGKLL
ncbi:DNA helicase UvrD [Candidatus Uhrbacteria bacterium]|nr:DNA helicase UvrD [Candidatus Uhrbacteria bacterium]